MRWILAAFLCVSFSSAAQTGPADARLTEQARQLSAEQRWEEIVRLVESVLAPSAELDFYYGTALAQLARWQDARRVLQAGARLLPGDKRFPQELAGVAFRQKNYPEAARNLRRALRLAPDDSYSNDFLGTVYFLEGNPEAALKYWKRVEKPQIAKVRADPTPKADPALVDRAFAFSPAGVLKPAELLTTEERLQGLDIFARHQFDLQARQDGKFDVVFRNQERNGWGRNKWGALLALLRGLPFQSINPEFYNFRHEAINLVSLFRWDAQKRRVLATVSGPWERNPKYRYRFNLDLRNENWNVLTSFTDPASLLGSLNLRREAVGAEFASFVSGRWRWSTGLEISHRDFRSVVSGTGLTPELLAKGYQLKQVVRLDAQLWRLPEHRLTLEGGVSSQAGRIWSQPDHSFEKLQSSLLFRWFPKAVGDDYEVNHQIRAGKTFGDVPFDELLVLGLERDNDLQMRAHIGTRGGKKGSAPLGRNYFLSNWEIDKNVYQNGLFAVKLGPFLDTGKITDPIVGLGSHKWLWDTGAQAKLRVLGIGAVLSYGKDLRSGNNAFYLRLSR